MKCTGHKKRGKTRIHNKYGTDQAAASQTWCPGSVLGYGHQCERSILVLPVQKLQHGTRVQALSPKVVFRHRTQARTGTCLHKIPSVPCFLPMFPCDLKLRWWDGRRNDCYYRCIQWEHGSGHLVWTAFHLVPGHGHQVWTGPKMFITWL